MTQTTQRTVRRGFTILAKTDDRLQKIAERTALRRKQNVVDAAVEMYWNSFLHSNPDLMTDEDGKRVVAVQGSDGTLRTDPSFR